MYVKKRGRPSKSIVRERLKEILAIKHSLTAYTAHKIYCSLFAKTSQRNIYYQLQKGVILHDFNQEVVQEKGDFSWGGLSRKVYYSLHPSQQVNVSTQVFELLKKRGE